MLINKLKMKIKNETNNNNSQKCVIIDLIVIHDKWLFAFRICSLHSSRRFNFFNNIRIGNDTMAKFLFSSLGNKDSNLILLKYDITPKPPPRHLNNAMWSHFGRSLGLK